MTTGEIKVTLQGIIDSKSCGKLECSVNCPLFHKGDRKCCRYLHNTTSGAVQAAKEMLASMPTDNSTITQLNTLIANEGACPPNNNDCKNCVLNSYKHRVESSCTSDTKSVQLAKAYLKELQPCPKLTLYESFRDMAQRFAIKPSLSTVYLNVGISDNFMSSDLGIPFQSSTDFFNAEEKSDSEIDWSDLNGSLSKSLARAIDTIEIDKEIK